MYIFLRFDLLVPPAVYALIKAQAPELNITALVQTLLICMRKTIKTALTGITDQATLDIEDPIILGRRRIWKVLVPEAPSTPLLSSTYIIMFPPSAVLDTEVAKVKDMMLTKRWKSQNISL